MKHITRIVSVLLSLLMICSCAFAEADLSSVLATVNGKPVDIVDAFAEYEYYSTLYLLYGYGEDDLAELRDEITHAYVQMELVYQKYDELELGKDYDMEAMKAAALTAFEGNVDGYKAYVSKEGKTEEQIDQEARALMESDGYGVDYFERMLYNQERILAVIDYYSSEITISDEEVRAYYDELLTADMTTFDSNPAAYEEAINYGDRVLYVPEGFRAVKHILIMLSDEDITRMYTLESDLEEINLALAQSTADTADLTAQKAAIEAEMDEIFTSIEPRAQEVLNKLANGEDFIDLMNEYGEDPGMTSEPYMTDGYMVFAESEQWVLPFRDAAMALEKIGDISQPVRTTYGLHIIRYEYDVAGGAVPFEDVQASLQEELHEERLDVYFSALVDQWYDEAELVLYPEHLIG